MTEDNNQFLYLLKREKFAIKEYFFDLLHRTIKEEWSDLDRVETLNIIYQRLLMIEDSIKRVKNGDY